MGRTIVGSLVLLALCFISARGQFQINLQFNSLQSFSKNVLSPNPPESPGVPTKNYQPIIAKPTKDGQYYYGFFEPDKDGKLRTLVIKEETPVANYMSEIVTCNVQLNTTENPKVTPVIQPWTDHKVLVSLEFRSKASAPAKVSVRLVNMTDCKTANVAELDNIELFQIYSDNPKEFDILYTETSEGPCKTHVCRNTYSGAEVKAVHEKQKEVEKPKSEGGSRAWTALLLGQVNQSSIFLHEINATHVRIIRVHTDKREVSELQLFTGKVFQISNEHNQLGFCKVTAEKNPLSCLKYNINGEVKLEYSPDLLALLQKHDINEKNTVNPPSIMLVNLKDEKQMMHVFLTGSKKHLIDRAFGEVLKSDGTMLDNSTAIEFHEPDFRCDVLDENIPNSMPFILANVVEKNTDYCLQFICIEAKESVVLRAKCAPKDLFLKARKQKKNGSDHVKSSFTVLLGSFLVFFANKFFM